MDYLLERLSEKTTWVSACLIVAQFVPAVTPTVGDMVANIGVAIAAMVLFFVRPKAKDE